MTHLFQPLQIGSLKIKNRIIMAPLTRSRASGADGRTPNDLMLKYYVQRVSAGLILTEATSVTSMGVGYANTPGIWSQEHIDGWKKITDAVHQKDGKIILQLWHVGRVSHSSFLNGKLPVAPSAIAPKGFVSLLEPKTAFEIPRALEISEIQEIIHCYQVGAENAKKAGFDGVEIHGANGYLIDQFLQDVSNTRSDIYGGSIENRARFMMEVTDVVLSVWEAGRVGMHISPRGDAQSMGDSNKQAVFSYVAEELRNRKLAFIFAREYQGADSIGPKLKKIFQGVFIANEKYTQESAEVAIQSGDADAVSFGKYYISNPDLVHKFQNKLPLTPFNTETFYRGGEIGYTNYKDDVG